MRKCHAPERAPVRSACSETRHRASSRVDVACAHPVRVPGRVIRVMSRLLTCHAYISAAGFPVAAPPPHQQGGAHAPDGRPVPHYRVMPAGDAAAGGSGTADNATAALSIVLPAALAAQTVPDRRGRVSTVPVASGRRSPTTASEGSQGSGPGRLLPAESASALAARQAAEKAAAERAAAARERADALVAQLGDGGTACDACLDIAALCAGGRDAPVDPDACVALLRPGPASESPAPPAGAPSAGAAP